MQLIIDVTFFHPLKPVLQQKYSTQCWNHHFNWSFWVLIRKWNKDFPRQLGTMMGYGEDWNGGLWFAAQHWDEIKISPKTLASAAISMRNLGSLISFVLPSCIIAYGQENFVSYIFMKALELQSQISTTCLPYLLSTSTPSKINLSREKMSSTSHTTPGWHCWAEAPNFGGLGGASPMSCTSSSSWAPQGNFGRDKSRWMEEIHDIDGVFVDGSGWFRK